MCLLGLFGMDRFHVGNLKSGPIEVFGFKLLYQLHQFEQHEWTTLIS